MTKTIVAVVVLAVGLCLMGGQDKHVHKHVVTTTTEPVATTTTIPVEAIEPAPALMKWDTTATDPTASWPDATDPMWKQPLKVQETFACIRYHESRNHRVDTTVSSGAEGWYMFMPYEWKVARAHIPGLPAHPNEATGDQQSEVALWYYHRNNGPYPEWSLDLC
jgi:hypothetical protein